MFDLFDDVTRPNTNIITVGNWPLVSEQIHKNVQSVLDHYNSWLPTVKNDHILVRFIKTFTTPLDTQIERYCTRIEDEAKDIARVLGFTTVSTTGRAHKNNFYKNTSEFIFCHHQYFDPYTYENNWKEDCGIQVMSHPVVAMDYVIPGTHMYAPGDGGYSVMYIDPVKLMLAYRSFVLFEAKISDRELSIHNFVAGFVLPSMLKRHVDIVICNRVYQSAQGVDPRIYDTTPEMHQHQFALIQNSSMLQNCIKKIADNTTVDRYGLYKCMKNTYLPFSGDLYELLKSNYITRSKQADWLLAMMKYRFIKHLFELQSDTVDTTDRSLVSNIGRNLVRNDTALSGILMIKTCGYGYDQLADELQLISSVCRYMPLKSRIEQALKIK